MMSRADLYRTVFEEHNRFIGVIKDLKKENEELKKEVANLEERLEEANEMIQMHEDSEF